MVQFIKWDICSLRLSAAFTLRTTALALCFSTAEYTCPVWERSAHAAKIDSSLNDMLHADELQDALNRPPNKVSPPPPAFAVKYPANSNDKNAIWTNDIRCTN